MNELDDERRVAVQWVASPEQLPTVIDYLTRHSSLVNESGVSHLMEELTLVRTQLGEAQKNVLDALQPNSPANQVFQKLQQGYEKLHEADNKLTGIVEHIDGSSRTAFTVPPSVELEIDAGGHPEGEKIKRQLTNCMPKFHASATFGASSSFIERYMSALLRAMNAMDLQKTDVFVKTLSSSHAQGR